MRISMIILCFKQKRIHKPRLMFSITIYSVL